MKLIRVKCKDYDFDKVRPIFEKEVPQLLDKLNKYIKKHGYKMYYKPWGKIYFSDGYRVLVKMENRPSFTEDERQKWWSCLRMMEGMSTKNLEFHSSLYESHNNIALKKTYRPESHRGQIAHPEMIGWSSSGT